MTKTAERLHAQRAGQLLKGRTRNAHKPITSEPEVRSRPPRTEVGASREGCVKAKGLMEPEVARIRAI